MSGKRDSILFAVVIGIVLAGIFGLISASLGLFEGGSSPFKVLSRQFAIGLGLGLALFFITDKIHYRFWHRTALWFFLAAFFLTLLVFVPSLGFKSGGAARWLDLGVFSFQPSEFLKLGFIMYLAAWLYSRRNEVGSIRFGVLPILLMILAMSAIFFTQPDLGTLGVIVISGLFLFFVAGGKLRHLGLMGVLMAVLLATVIYFKPYSLERVQVFWDREHDLQGAGYQARQAAIAFGSGGIFGKGFGQGLQKYNYLPESTTDAIFAVVGEEFGFIGASFLVFLFLLFLWRSVIILKRSTDIFAGFLGAGIVIIIVVQAFINMSAIAGLIPLTGITLPFMSQGGSSFVSLFAALGILSNISKNKK